MLPDTTDTDDKLYFNYFLCSCYKLLLFLNKLTYL